MNNVTYWMAFPNTKNQKYKQYGHFSSPYYKTRILITPLKKLLENAEYKIYKSGSNKQIEELLSLLYSCQDYFHPLLGGILELHDPNLLTYLKISNHKFVKVKAGDPKPSVYKITPERLARTNLLISEYKQLKKICEFKKQSKVLISINHSIENMKRLQHQKTYPLASYIDEHINKMLKFYKDSQSVYNQADLDYKQAKDILDDKFKEILKLWETLEE